MYKNLRLNLLAKEIITFSMIPFLAILAGIQYYKTVEIVPMSTGFSIPWFLLSMAAAVLIIFALIKLFKVALPFKIMLSITMLVGSMILLKAFLNSIYAAILAVVLVIAYWGFRNVLVHNLVIIISVSGVALYLGLFIPVTALLILLGIVAVYDVIAVFKTKHMITMFQDMAKRGAVMALVIPEKLSLAKEKLKSAKSSMGKKISDRSFIFIGTGDAAFPTMLAVSALRNGLAPAIGAAVGAVCGMIAVHFILLKLERPLPALPPIAVGSSLGYLIGLLI